MFIGVFFGSFVNPQAIVNAAAFGPMPANTPMNTEYWLFVLRELCLGVALLVLEAYGEWRAVTVLLGCVGINGVGDFVLAGMKGAGWKASMTSNLVPTLVGYWAVYKLWEEHWGSG